ncbi:LysR family transcriptional regulator [Ferrimonas marina]|uniref:DNA-binding transcriptional regulator, LysR family n=1 Tax=Ferrimonas marina TaxID=299255 RepID=A0A1M5RB11_9GAMM|nr:LysR family transcriptional regulator [Ferrimonas marina]SHH23495.1 DNA-binding transcriptional regulator, LysR family [Ferrimonas marina]
MLFSLEQLSAFVTVYEYGSFSKAAAKLEKHRTTVAQVIGNLEDLVGVELFERVGRSVNPTIEGEKLYHYGKQVIEQARAFDKFALSLSFNQLETLNLGYTTILPHGLLAAIRLRLAEKYPSMAVNFIALTKNETKSALNEGRVHIGIVNIEQRSVIHSMDATFLGYLTFGAYVAKDSPLAKMPSDQVFTALKTERQLVLSSMIEDELSEKVILSANYERVDQLSLAIKLVEQGVGWSLLPRALIETEYVKERLVAVQADEVLREVAFPLAVWSPFSEQVSGIKKLLVEEIKEYVVAMGGVPSSRMDKG